MKELQTTNIDIHALGSGNVTIEKHIGLLIAPTIKGGSWLRQRWVAFKFIICCLWYVPQAYAQWCLMHVVPCQAKDCKFLRIEIRFEKGEGD